MKRAETEGTVIARGISKGEHLFTAIFTYKAVVVFSESFVFHIVTFGYDLTSSGKNRNKNPREEV